MTTALANSILRNVFAAPHFGAAPRFLRDLPMLRKLIARLSAHRVPYADFAAARRAPVSKPIGYEACPGDLYEPLRRSLIPGDLKSLEWIDRQLPQVRRLFDFGGNLGLQFYGFQSRLVWPEGFSWEVCEIAPFVEEGRKIAAREGARELSFTYDFGDSSGADFLLASGCLHYLEESFGAMLRGLEAPAARLLINRVPLTQGASTVTLQDIGKAYLPVVIRNRREFLEDIEACGYALKDSWSIPDLKCTMPFYPERSAHAYEGFYFERS
jgi:putative methyltransferase (TIGR04325 family)